MIRSLLQWLSSSARPYECKAATFVCGAAPVEDEHAWFEELHEDEIAVWRERGVVVTVGRKMVN